MTKDEALRLALEALSEAHYVVEHRQDVKKREQAITAIKAALEAKDDGITLTTIRHPRGKPALGELNPESLEQVEIDVLEPVAYINVEQRKLEWAKYMSWDTPTVVNLPKIPLYATPPQRPWVVLTDKEIEAIWKIAMFTDYGIGAELSNQPFVHYAKAIEAKLKEKNNG
jgi:hypothetical protein